MSASNRAIEKLNRVQMLAIVAAVVGLVGLGAAFATTGASAHRGFYEAYLIGWMLAAGLSIASLGLLMLHHMVGGNWGFVSRRLFEAGAMLLPLMLILFIPIALNTMAGDASIYEWAHHATGAIVAKKIGYLNPPFWIARIIFYFLVWTVMAFLLNKYSMDLDRTGDVSIIHRFKVVSGPGILIFVLILTFFSIDTLMSLEPEWYSSIFGILLMVSQVLSCLSLVVIFLNMLRDEEPFAGVMIARRFHDLGNLLLCFVMLWTYFSFSQYLISWSGNLPDEAVWYKHRFDGGWSNIIYAIAVGHFALPFLLLLSRQIKKNSSYLALVGAWIIFMRFVDLYWLVSPTPVFGHAKLADHTLSPLFDIAGALAFLGIWLAAFVWRLKSRPLMPVFMSHMEHPRPIDQEALNHG